jgi:hypothetical protein
MATPASTSIPLAVSRNTDKSRPYFKQKVRLNSFHAQQVFDRGFDLCSSSIFTLSVVLRVIGSNEQAMEVEDIADAHINSIFGAMHDETDRLVHLAEKHGIELTGIDYSSPKEVDAMITSPRAVRYLALIREFDALVARFDVLWLSGTMPDGDYSRHVYEWKRKLLRVAGEIRTIARRAMNAARRKDAPSEPTPQAQQTPAAGAESTNDPIMAAQSAGSRIPPLAPIVPVTEQELAA